MGSKASFKGHPIHPMLIPFPIALWIFSLVSDFIYVFGAGSMVWREMALYTMAGGLIGALAAAVPGYIDYRSIKEAQTAAIGWWHMVINLTVVMLYTINMLLRLVSDNNVAAPIFLSLVGVGLLGISGWLGGEMVYVHGVAVEQPASRGVKMDTGQGTAHTRKRTGTL